MNFIKSIVKPCFHSLSSHDYLVARETSIIGRQLDENELTWEMTRVDQDTGILIVPEKSEIQRLLAERKQLSNEQDVKESVYRENKVIDFSFLKKKTVPK